MHQEFRDNKLYIVTNKEVLVLRAWPNPQAWRLRKRWEGCRPNFKICNPRRLGRTSYHRFLATIPTDVRKLIASFPEFHWELLTFAARCGDRAVLLLKENPALGFALALNHLLIWPRPAQPMHLARKLLKKRRRDIAAAVGFPRRESVVKMLARVHPASVGVMDIHNLRLAVCRGLLPPYASHIPVITTGVIALLSPVYWQSVHPRVVFEVSRKSVKHTCPNFAAALEDIIQRRGRHGLPGLTARELQSPKHLWKEYHRVIALPPIQPDRYEFPKAPIPGTSTIVPIETEDDLYVEGKTMDNCCARFRFQIADGTCYFYRVLAPERATLGLRRNRATKMWESFELRCEKNCEAEPATAAAVERWLKEARIPDGQMELAACR